MTPEPTCETCGQVHRVGRGYFRSHADWEAWREKLSGRTLSPAHRSKLSAASSHRYEDPAEREKTGDAGRRNYEDPAEREKTAAALRGIPKSPEHLLSCALGQAARMRRHPTEPERALYRMLEKRGLDFIPQAVVAGRYIVDALMPSERRAYEADCHWMHQYRDPEKVALREQAILSSGEVDEVVYMTAEELAA